MQIYIKIYDNESQDKQLQIMQSATDATAVIVNTLIQAGILSTKRHTDSVMQYNRGNY